MNKKKVLITGGTGFVGSNFTRKFLENGEEVHLIVRSKSDFWRLDSIKNLLNLHLINLADAEQTESFVRELQPQIILHFAAHPGYTGKPEDVEPTITTNVLGTVNLINACSKINFECFINTGSSSEYGVKDNPMKESDILEPNNLYGVTKATATLYGQLMARKFDLPIVNARLFSPFGYFDRKRLIPAAICAYFRNSVLDLSTPHSMRDYIFIEDVFDAYLLLIKNIASIKGEIFNIGSGKQYSSADVVAMIGKIFGASIKVRYGTIPIRQIEPKNWVADMTKIEQILRFKPKFSLEEGLKKTIDWLKNNQHFYEGFS